VKPDNQPHNTVKLEVIQGGINPARQSEQRPAIPLQRTNTTGLGHKDGTVSMARAEPSPFRPSPGGADDTSWQKQGHGKTSVRLIGDDG
jgi:hypothetical protein